MADTELSPKFDSEEQFLDLCEFASTCDLNDPECAGDQLHGSFIQSLLNHYFVWCKDTKIDCPILPSIQLLLGSTHLRTELASVLFRHGAPCDGQIEATFRLLFQASLSRHRLVSKANAKVPTCPSGH